MLGELALMAALGYGGWRLAKQAFGTVRRQQARHDANHAAATEAAQRRYAERLRRERQEAAQRRVAARNMQLALLQLRQAPDFRRAAGHAELARNVPLSFRQRQFRRFRPQLVNAIAERLRAGAATDEAAAGLPELVTALGLASYEAEYIIAEAQGRQTVTTAHRCCENFPDTPC